MDLILRISPHDKEPFTYRCDGPEVVMGRSSRAHVTLPGDQFLSREHARLFRKEDDWFVENKSRNGTVLNGKAVDRAVPISPGDTILIGDCKIRVGSDEDEIFDTSSSTSEIVQSDQSLFRSAQTIIAQSARPKASAAPTEELELLRRHAARLKVLNEVHKALATSMSVEDLFEMILDRVFALLLPEEAVIFLKDEATDDFVRRAVRRLPHLANEDYFYSRSLVREVTEKRLAALTNDATSDQRFVGAESVMDAGVRSLLAAPLLHGDACPGMIVLTSRLAVKHFSQDDMELLVSLASVAALQLRHMAHLEEAARRRELERDLTVAREIQRALLPERLPLVRGWAFFARNVPSRHVSGDLYRFQEREGGDACLVLVADVSGKGMPASLLTASLEALAAGPMEMGRPPEELVTKLSRRLHQRTPPERFATAFVASLASGHGEVSYANAGHNPALVVRRSGEIEELGATGVPLGLLADSPFSEAVVTLADGDTLVLYTDGITEALNPEDEEYGLGRLEEVCKHARMSTVDAMGEAIADDLESFVQGTLYGDDRTLVLARRVLD